MTENERDEIIELVDSILFRFSNEIQAWKKAITSSFTQYKRDEVSYDSVYVFMNIRLSIMDIAILYKHILRADSDKEYNLFARLMCGQLYEFVKDVPKMLGKKFRITLSKFPQHKELEKDLNCLIKEFHSHKIKFSTIFKDIRNNVSFHRDIDGLKQIDLIEGFDLMIVVSAFYEITDWYSEFADFESKIIEIGEQHNPINQ